MQIKKKGRWATMLVFAVIGAAIAPSGVAGAGSWTSTECMAAIGKLKEQELSTVFNDSSEGQQNFCSKQTEYSYAPLQPAYDACCP